MTTPDAADLNPGTDNFTFGAHVRLSATDLTSDHDSNLVQKGKFNTAQYKIQFDDPAGGTPTCVIRGSADPSDKTVVNSTVGVADGNWHKVTCERTVDKVSILVDGTVTGTQPVAADLDVNPAGESFTVGANGAYLLNDQYHGDLDAVFFGSSEPDPLISVTDSAGTETYEGTVNVSNGGEVTEVTPGAEGTAKASSFPAVCPNTNPNCPRAVVKGPADESLNPGISDFSFGVSVALDSSELTSDHGSNLVQKGKFNTAQYKIQLDDTDGKPSCVVRGSDDPSDRTVVNSTIEVADGNWHKVTCERIGDELSILVDGTVAGAETLDASLDIDPSAESFTVGANGAYISNDQYHGDLDEVFFNLG